ncbi:MAG: hypothetical protein KIT84_29175 [Labilithrix sp.]|nr:hypothetical protein [Labilithrix sp.]MCW5815134.1 hypothetical protein [Labilithrix sp.]
MKLRRAAFALVLLACSEETAPPKTAPVAEPCTPVAYPAGPYGTEKGSVVRNRTLAGVRADGTAGRLSFADFSNSCGELKPLVIRVVAGFCGTCRASAEHGTEALTAGVRERANVLDVVVRDEDSALPEPDAAKRWQSIEDVATSVVVDPDGAFVVDDRKLPRVLVVDPKTMAITADLDDPTAEAIESAVLGTAQRPTPLVDGRFTKLQWKMIEEMPLTGGPPPDPTNIYGDRPGAAAFGRRLFDDKGLSPSAEVSCERCHTPARQFTDGSVKAVGGVGESTRNTPTVILAAWQRWQLWDGRADTLWMQALLPLEDPTEFGSSRLYVAHRIERRFHEDYEAVFGPMPYIDDVRRFPNEGKPGDPAWEAMAPEDQETITGIFVNAGKAMAAFERAFRVNPTDLDLYARGDMKALTDAQKDGLAAFFTAGCAQCHYGPRLTDDAFHALRFPSGREDFTPDDGRIAARKKYDANEFRSDSKWSDAPTPRRRVTTDPETLGAFKTPALRGVVLTGPYGHGGGVPSLPMVIELHRKRGMPEGARLTNGVVDPWLVSFDPALDEPLLALLRTQTFGNR